MTTQSILGTTIFPVPEGYPLGVYTIYEPPAGTTALLAILISATGFSYVPFANFGGFPFTQLAGASDLLCNIWAFGLAAPPAGKQFLEVACNAEWTGPGWIVVIALSGTASAPLDGAVAAIGAAGGVGGTTQTLTVRPAEADGLLIAIGGILFDGGNNLPSIESSTGGTAFEQFFTYQMDVLNSISIAAFSAAAGAGGIPYSAVVAAPWNADLPCALIALAPTVAVSQTITPAGILSSTAVGQPGIVQTPFVLAPGESATVTVAFTPTVIGARGGSLAINSDTTGTTTSMELQGQANNLLPLSTRGNQIVDSNGAVIRLRSCNWYGLEQTNFFPDSFNLESPRPWEFVLDTIKAMGFNCVRISFSTELLTAFVGGNSGQSQVGNYQDYPALRGATALQGLDLIINYGASIGLRFVLDHHRVTAFEGYGTDAWNGIVDTSTGVALSEAEWIAMWIALSKRYASNPAVCGFDPHNEPYNFLGLDGLPNWSLWKKYVEDAANAVHAFAPGWLVFVEGLGKDTCPLYDGWCGWGSGLAYVATDPIVIATPHKIVYSPHDYGVVAGVQWLQAVKPPMVVEGWPTSIANFWNQHWGFIFLSHLAPIWLGEFGGGFGFNPDTGAAGDLNQPNAADETQWLASLVAYLNGDLALDSSSVLLAGEEGMSFAYFAVNHNAGITGGLLESDSKTLQAGKLALVAPLLTT